MSSLNNIFLNAIIDGGVIWNYCVNKIDNKYLSININGNQKTHECTTTRYRFQLYENTDEAFFKMSVKKHIEYFLERFKDSAIFVNDVNIDFVNNSSG